MTQDTTNIPAATPAANQTVTSAPQPAVVQPVQPEKADAAKVAEKK